MKEPTQQRKIPLFHKRGWRVWGIVALLAVVGVGLWHTKLKPLPKGISYRSEERVVAEKDITFLSDLTYTNAQGESVREQEIFDRIFTLIDGAEEYILIDMFLFNDYMGGSTEKPYRDLYGELTRSLIEKKQNQPSILIDFITDPINQVYSGVRLAEFEAMKASGIHIIETDVRSLRDSNPLYSAFWRVGVAPFGVNPKSDWLPNPFDKNAEKVGLRNWLALINFKANHRKIFVSDNGNTMTSVVMSANPHNGSSAHSNVALEISGDFWRDIYRSEKAVAKMSGESLLGEEVFLEKNSNSEKEEIISEEQALVGLVTEGKIKKYLLEQLDQIGQGDTVDIAMFYFSDRDIVKGLLRASEKGADIRLVLDANKDAFGYEKTGIPNRQVANELHTKSNEKISIRWYKTQGEQFHSKMISIEKKDKAIVLLGSTNLTRRNSSDLNLESDVWVEIKKESQLHESIQKYFEKIYNNTEGNIYTLDYAEYQENIWWKNILYRFQEFSGLSSF